MVLARISVSGSFCTALPGVDAAFPEGLVRGRAEGDPGGAGAGRLGAEQQRPGVGRVRVEGHLPSAAFRVLGVCDASTVWCQPSHP